MFGLFSSTPTVPTYPELASPTDNAGYAAAADAAKTKILELLATTDGWQPMKSPVEGIDLKTKEIAGSPANIARAEAVVEIPVEALVKEIAGTDGAHFRAQEEELLDWKVVKTVDETNHVIYSGHKTPFPVTDRELCYLRTQHKLDGGAVLMVGVSINDKDVPTAEGRVRAVVLACWLFKPQEDGKTHVTRCIQLDPKGSVPSFLINAQQAKAAIAINVLKTHAK